MRPHLLPSVGVTHWHASWTDTPSANPMTMVGWRRTSTGADIIVVTTGMRQGSTNPSAGGHSVIWTVTTTTTRPASSHREASHGSTASPSLLKHHGETTIIICFIIKVGVIGLCATFYRSLKWRTKILRTYTRNYKSYCLK